MISVTVLGLVGRATGETPRVADSSAAGACRVFLNAYRASIRAGSRCEDVETLKG